jgi:hypothetical protein
MMKEEQNTLHVFIQTGSILFITYLSAVVSLPILLLCSTVDSGLDSWLGRPTVGCSLILALIYHRGYYAGD